MKKTLKVQTTLRNTFASQLLPASDKTMAIMRDICVFITADMGPFFRWKIWDFCDFFSHWNLNTPSHHIHAGPEPLQRVQGCTDSESETILITTDGWTSRYTQGYITITAHTINSDWELVNVALQNSELLEDPFNYLYPRAVGKCDMPLCQSYFSQLCGRTLRYS